MPINTNMWGQGWGSFNPFRSTSVPSSMYKKYNPNYQSPYASDPTSSSARVAAGLDPTRIGTTDEMSTWNNIKDSYTNPMQAMMQRLGMFGSNPSSGGGGTQPDPYAGMTQLWRDPSGMIHDFGDNPQPTTQPNGSMDMTQMMNIFQLLNGMNSYQNRGRQNRGRGGNGYGDKMRRPGDWTTAPLGLPERGTMGPPNGNTPSLLPLPTNGPPTTPTTPTTPPYAPPPQPWIGEDPASIYTQQ